MAKALPARGVEAAKPGTARREIPDGAMVLGSPGKVVKTRDAEAVAALRRTAGVYREKLARYRAGLRPLRGGPVSR